MPEFGTVAGMIMKKNYNGLIITEMECSIEGPVLVGSVTTEKILVEKVTVEEYQNGFDTEATPNGFQDLNFD